MSEVDINFIKKILEVTPKLIIVITKIDFLNETELKDIVSFTNEYIKKELNINPPIYQFSIYNKLTLETIIKFFIDINKNYKNEIEKILKYKVISALDVNKSYLELAVKLKEIQDKNLSEIKNTILDEKLSLEYVRKELTLITKYYLNSTRDKVQNVLIKYEKEINIDLKTELENIHSKWNGNLYKVSRKHEAFLQNYLRNKLKLIVENENGSWNTIMNNPANHFISFINSFRESVNTKLETILGIKIKNFNLNFQKERILYPDIVSVKSFDIPLDLIWFLFPMAIFRNIFNKHFIRQIPLMVERNIYRLISELTNNLNKEILSYKVQSLNYISSELITINQILKKQNYDKESLISKIEEVNNLISKFLLNVN